MRSESYCSWVCASACLLSDISPLECFFILKMLSCTPGSGILPAMPVEWVLYLQGFVYGTVHVCRIWTDTSYTLSLTHPFPYHRFPFSVLPLPLTSSKLHVPSVLWIDEALGTFLLNVVVVTGHSPTWLHKPHVQQNKNQYQSLFDVMGNGSTDAIRTCIVQT